MYTILVLILSSQGENEIRAQIKRDLGIHIYRKQREIPSFTHDTLWGRKVDNGQGRERGTCKPRMEHNDFSEALQAIYPLDRGGLNLSLHIPNHEKYT